MSVCPATLLPRVTGVPVLVQSESSMEFLHHPELAQAFVLSSALQKGHPRKEGGVPQKVPSWGSLFILALPTSQAEEKRRKCDFIPK